MEDQNVRRYNTDLTADLMQFNTPRGNVPFKVAQAAANSAPPMDPRTASRYPREYRNREGRNRDLRKNFEEWETYEGRAGTTKYTEFPVNPAGVQTFNYHKKAASARQVALPIHPNDRKRVVQNPLNDPGALRAITTQDTKQVVGALYHPNENPTGYKRGVMQPLDRAGRVSVQQLKEYELRKTQTLK
ncbi:hypothetical protein LZ32DRAFT_644828 [Colletotrichum eremochloae]|nr:hypothetical protein LZ32DRAFT_644828 [Colletotrichum eremochloae]